MAAAIDRMTFMTTIEHGAMTLSSYGRWEAAIDMIHEASKISHRAKDLELV